MFFLLVFSSIAFLVLGSLVPVSLPGRLFSFIGIFVYSMTVASRGESGSDTFLYVALFEQPGLFRAFQEPAIPYLFEILRNINLSFQAVLVLQGILCFFSLYLIWKNSGARLVAFYIALFGVNIDFSTLRQSFGLHILVILALGFKHKYLPLLAVTFHVWTAAGFAAFAKGKLAIALSLGLGVVAFFYLRQYLDEGLSFLVREDSTWIVQAVFAIMFLHLEGVTTRWLMLAAVLLAVPIGYRVLACLFPFFPIKRVSPRLAIFSALLLLTFTYFKLSSFERQSLENDGDRSVVRHFGKGLF